MRGVVAVMVALATVWPAAPASADVADDAAWIVAAQLDDGAIATHVDREFVSPYLANLAASGLAAATRTTGDPAYAAAAWRWVEWYGAHQGPDGVVHDHRVTAAGGVASTGKADSTDAYAGTFLLALRDVHAVAPDPARLAALAPAVDGALRAIEATQAADGLTWATPTSRVKYLMDQGETYAGLVAGVDLAVTLGDLALAERAAVSSRRMVTGVDRLWNARRGAFDWAVHGDGTRDATDWEVLFPDALQQVWAVTYGLVDEARAHALVETFLAHHPSWAERYWPTVATALRRVGRVAEADAGVARIRAQAAGTGRAWPWSVGDAGRVVLAATGLDLAGLPPLVLPAPPPAPSTAAPSVTPAPTRAGTPERPSETGSSGPRVGLTVAAVAVAVVALLAWRKLSPRARHGRRRHPVG